MFENIYMISIYLICFVASLYALSALDFNRFVKQGSVAKSQLCHLFTIIFLKKMIKTPIAFSLAYLSGSLILRITGH